jgi:hypothetical protein
MMGVHEDELWEGTIHAIEKYSSSGRKLRNFRYFIFVVNSSVSAIIVYFI